MRNAKTSRFSSMWWLIAVSTGSQNPTARKHPSLSMTIHNGLRAGGFVLALWLSLSAASGFTLLSSNELVFANVDHAPMGACSTITYGYKGDICGIGTETGNFPYWLPSGGGGGGVLIALSNSSGLYILPFVASGTSIGVGVSIFPDASVKRALTPCTDNISIPSAGVSFTHYTPAWPMVDFDAATAAEKKRFFLPATWMVFTVTNTNSTPEDFYFGLPVAVTQKTFGNGAYQGFALGEAALAVQTGSCDVVSGTRLTSVFSGMNQGFAFHVNVPAGQTRSLTVVLAYYRSAVVDSRTGGVYYYTTLYPSIDSVIDAAFAELGDVQARSQQLADVMSRAGLNPYRQFLACHALRSYMADTACLINPQGVVSWREVEGIFDFINTFDLTVDHAFYDSIMHPWALRNVLDTFSGALPGTGYHFNTPLYNPASIPVSSNGFSFYHDMGHWPTSGTGPAYGGLMGDEELQTWILSAGLYWSHTGDNAWLTNNTALLQTLLNSMLLRDNTNAAARDGVTKNVNAGEISTYDNLDSSLQRVAYSGRLSVRNWACYLALNKLFLQIGDVEDATTCENMAGVVAQTITSRWNSYRTSLGYITALLDNSSSSATFPMVEGLAYPAAMGLTNAIDRTGGPYASMLQALSNHVIAVLVPGRCLDSGTGASLITSGSSITWQSKVFVCQYVAEAVLGITNNSVNGTVDQANVSVQLGGAPFQGYSDAFLGSGALEGGHHYPRAATTILWWWNPTNNPAYPGATSAPNPPSAFSAQSGNQQILLLWQGVPLATGYNLKRSTTSGGPYTTLTNDFFGGSYVDSGVNNGTTYYYVLTATNQIGESVSTPEVSATPGSSVTAGLSASLSASKVTIAWPASYLGWILQTNSIDVSNSGQWHDVPGSANNSQMTFPTDAPSAPSQFFRLRHP